MLHRVVRDHLDAFLDHAAESYEAPLPRYVREELRGYLRCGLHEHGFLRARCETCGHDLLIAFSCKSRGLCPSCAGRRMSNTAAHLVDRVIPAVPVRQWVLSLPMDVRAQAAFDAAFLTAAVRVFADVLRRRHRAWASGIGLDATEFAAITFVQRFGSSLNLNVHLHVVVVDGVFSRDASAALQFTQAPTPSPSDMAAMVQAIARRINRRVEKTKSVEPPPEGALARCAQLALFRGDVRRVADAPEASETARSEPEEPAATGAAVDCDGYNLEASVRIGANDDFGREHLLRYCARPPLALGRMSLLPTGKIAYRIKKLRGGKAKVRILTPLELLARLAAIIPPPRHPLVRFHGAFAPRSSWRRDVVPKPPSKDAQSKHPTHRPRSQNTDDDQPTRSRPRPLRSPTNSALVPQTEPLSSNVIAVHHWERLHAGALLATSPRLDWAQLLRRTFDVDALECPKCAGRIRVLNIVDDNATAKAILDELGIPAAPRPRARDPSLPFIADSEVYYDAP